MELMQCESYMRLAKESMAQEEAAVSTDYDVVDGDDDKTYAAMNIAKTIGTVRIYLASAAALESIHDLRSFLPLTMHPRFLLKFKKL